jgi:hypothetical protein
MQTHYQKSLDFLAGAATRFQTTMGMEHMSAAKTAFKLACLHILMQDYTSARYTISPIQLIYKMHLLIQGNF